MIYDDLSIGESDFTNFVIEEKTLKLSRKT
jgi:hypothetical protein